MIFICCHPEVHEFTDLGLALGYSGRILKKFTGDLELFCAATLEHIATC